MGFDVDIIVEEDSLAPELVCPICAGIIDSPIRTPCSHLFCQECISVWFSRSKDCPQCRAAITAPNSSNVDRLLKNIIGATRVRCLKFKGGCNWVGKLDDLLAHKCSLCSCPNCPFKAESESKTNQIRELTEKIAALETEIVALRIRTSLPPSPSPSPSPSSSRTASILPFTSPPPPSVSPRPSSSPSPASTPATSRSTLPSSSPSSPSPSPSPALPSSRTAVLAAFASNPPPVLSPSLSISSPSSSTSSQPPPSSSIRANVNFAPAAPSARSLVCNYCQKSEAERYSYYRCSECPGPHHKAKQDFHLCAPCFLIYPPVHVGRFAKVE